jgi:hypothetical protein
MRREHTVSNEELHGQIHKMIGTWLDSIEGDINVAQAVGWVIDMLEEEQRAAAPARVNALKRLRATGLSCNVISRELKMDPSRVHRITAE